MQCRVSNSKYSFSFVFVVGFDNARYFVVPSFSTFELYLTDMMLLFEGIMVTRMTWLVDRYIYG
jgi:hypothetical protein